MINSVHDFGFPIPEFGCEVKSIKNPKDDIVVKGSVKIDVPVVSEQLQYSVVYINVEENTLCEDIEVPDGHIGLSAIFDSDLNGSDKGCDIAFPGINQPIIGYNMKDKGSLSGIDIDCDAILDGPNIDFLGCYHPKMGTHACHPKMLTNTLL